MHAGVEGPAPWSTVNVAPPTFTVPVRAGPLLACVCNRTTPLPVPVAPSNTAIQGALLTAVHAQPGGAVILNVNVSPEAGVACCAGSI